MKGFLLLLSQIILFLTVWLLWPRELDNYTLGAEGRTSVQDYAMKNARYVSVNQGRLEVEAFAVDATFDLKRKILLGANTKFYVFNEAQEKTTVWSDKTEYFMEPRKAHFIGNVRSESPDGFRLRSAEGNYSVAERFLTVPNPLEGESKDDTLKVWGDRGESHIDDKKIHLYGNARANYVDKKEGLTKVRGDRAVVDREKEKVDFYAHVQVDQAKVIGTSNHGEMFYDKQEKNLHYMALMDDVKIQDETGRYSRSQMAEFFSPTDTIVLSGFPSVYDKDDVVTGDKITLFRTTGVVEVTAANAAGSAKPTDQKPKSQVRHTDEDDELVP